MPKNDTPAAKAGKGQGNANARAQRTSAGQTITPESTGGLEVTSTRDGFRRAGFAWSKKPTVVPCADLTQEQIDMLINEPALAVREVDLPEQEEE